MCGICGVVRPGFAKQDLEIFRQMRDTMTYRGPDDSGMFSSGPISLGSRRLAILDLSPRGRMPMVSQDGRYQMVYNGEVYNFRELRASLEARGVCFHTDTDTEVLLQLYIAEGPAMLQRCNGMFALAIWDTREQVLFLARDRLGVKPLYYALVDGVLYFASEQKALFAAGCPAEFDESAWEELLYFRYVAGAGTPYRHVRRLLPGHYAIVRGTDVQIHQWWALRPDMLSDGELTRQSAIDQFQSLFDDSLRLRQISDVPVGVLLSGGLDSGSIAATMARQVGAGVESFTVRFAEPGYDEAAWAREVARQWNINYHELFVDPQRIPALLEEAAYLLGEPLVHANDLHLLAIARYAKPRVTVLLSGEGADEIFGGYVRYRPFLIPGMSRAGGKVAAVMDRLSPNGRLHKMSQLLAIADPSVRSMFSSAENFPSPAEAQRLYERFEYRRQVIGEAERVYASHARQVMYYDQFTYLQSILDRNDRMTMGASIECREPFLDYRLVEWAARLPTSMMFRGFVGKDIIRRAMRDQLPPSVLRHRKWGFGVPWFRYFREIPALRSWVQQIPKAEVMLSCPLPTKHVRSVIDAYLAGDDQHTPMVRQLALITVWYERCVRMRSNMFEYQQRTV